VQYQPLHDVDDNSTGRNPTKHQSSQGAHGNQTESNEVEQLFVTEGGETAIPHAAYQASVAEDDHDMVDAANQPPIAVDAANQPPVAVNAANQPPVAVNAANQ